MRTDNPLLFKDQTAVIVGGSSGLGLEIAKSFMNNGANLVIASRSSEKLKNASEVLLKETGKGPFKVVMDVVKKSSVEKGLKTILKKFSSVDIVVCTAGIYLKKKALETPFEDWKKIIDTNLTGTYHVNRIFGQEMVKKKKGSIINTASLGARVALSNTSAYNVSKSGVEMLTKSLACEWALHGVRVNAILPGVFKTELNAKALEDKERAENILRCTPMKRFGKLPEIVSAVLFLASPGSGFVTGSTVTVDGGFLAYAGF